ncbi:MAG TPA: DNA polymerase III subunit alpha [bacterium]
MLVPILHCHTAYSMRRGTALPFKIAEQASRLGYSHIAITDRDGLWGVPLFIDACKKVGLTHLIGAQYVDPEDSSRRVIALTENIGAFQTLSQISSRFHLEDNFNPVDAAIEKVDDGLILLADNPSTIKELHKKIPPGRLYGELYWGARSVTRKRFLAVLKTCRMLKRPVTTSGNIYMSEPEEFRVHALMTAMRTGRCLRDKLPIVDPDLHIKTPEEFHAPFMAYNLHDAILNAMEIANRCSWRWPVRTWHIPDPPDLPRGKRPIDHLRDIVIPKLKRKYKNWDGRTGPVAERLNMELDIIDEHGFASFFLIVGDVVREAHERGYRTLGRGSAGDSIVSYGIDISQVDPIRYDLYFERFLNPERSSPPDIDLDFAWTHRDEMVEYIEKKYGPERVASVGTIVNVGLRGAFRESGKALGYSNTEINRWSMYLPGHWDTGSVELSENPLTKELPLDEEPLKTIFDYSLRLQNLPLHQSVHVGGVVITPDPINRYAPLNRAAKGMVITQYDMRDCEKVGLIKLDLLSQRGLGVVEDCVEMIALNGKTVDYNLADMDELSADENIASLFNAGETLGCFDAESPMIRGLIKKLGGHSYDQHMQATALIRPGVSASGMMQEFIRRHHDHSKIKHAHPKMGEILHDTYGIIVYQEDVLKVLHKIAGVSLGEADLLRRMMSLKELESKSATTELEKKFINNCEARGIGSDVRQKIWDQIASFASFSFCKAHAAQFAIVAYQSAYFKAYHRAEFFATRLANVGGYYPPDVYIRDARRFNVKVELPEVNMSQRTYYGKDNVVIMGLEQVGCLHDDIIDSILLAKNVEGPFKSVADFVARTGTGYEQAHALIRVGAFRTLNTTRPVLLGDLAEAFRSKIHRPGKVRQPLLFPEKGKIEPEPSPPFAWGIKPKTSLPLAGGTKGGTWDHDYSLYEQIQAEVDVLGMIASIHPLEPIKKFMDAANFTCGKDMPRRVDKKVRMGGILVSFKPVRTRKDNQAMALISLEDLSGTFDVAVFPEAYRKHAVTLKTKAGQGLCMEGKVQFDDGAYTLVVENVYPLQDFLNRLKKIEKIRVEKADEDSFYGDTPMIFRRRNLQVDISEETGFERGIEYVHS